MEYDEVVKLVRSVVGCLPTYDKHTCEPSTFVHKVHRELHLSRDSSSLAYSFWLCI
jgi:hypothetical protein